MLARIELTVGKEVCGLDWKTWYYLVVEAPGVLEGKELDVLTEIVVSEAVEMWFGAWLKLVCYWKSD